MQVLQTARHQIMSRCHPALFSLLVLLVVAGCNRKSDAADSLPETQSTIPSSAISVEQASRDSILENIFNVGFELCSTRVDLRAIYGRPDSLQAGEWENLHTGGTDSTATWIFGGLQVGFWWSVEQDREFVTGVALTDSVPPLVDYFTVGRTRADDVVLRLGEPDRQSSIADTLVLSYLAPIAGPDQYVDFYVVSGVLRVIRWLFYID